MKFHINLSSKYCLIKLLATVAWFTTTTCYSDVIFSDNFDDTPDWQNVGSQRCKWIGEDKHSGNTDCANVPLNYDLMYVTDKNPASPMCQITSAAAKGPNGKGLRIYDESNGGKKSWGSDCQIAKYFPQQHAELWVSYYIHYNPDMIWESGTRSSKIFRIGHYNPLVIDGTTKSSAFNTNKSSSKNGGLGDTTAGLVILYVKLESSGAVRFQQGVRCSDYKCGKYKEVWRQNITGTQGVSWEESLGDNKWHHIEIGVKMNSNVGANDGVMELYFDGVLQTKRDDIPWRMAGVKDSVTGFNLFSIAGNSHNIWAGQTNEEQWMYNIDDLRVCTSGRCP